MKIFNFVSNLFKGRIGRMDYFLGGWWTLLVSLLMIPLWMLLYKLGLVISLDDFKVGSTSFIQVIQFSVTVVLEIIGILYFVILNASLHVRRGHDIGWGGGFSVFMMLLGIVITIPLFFFLFSSSKDQNSVYGKRHLGSFLQRYFNLSM